MEACPFCGSVRLKIDSRRTPYHGEVHCSVTTRCLCCHARGPVVGIVVSKDQHNEIDLCKDKVEELWDRRVNNATYRNSAKRSSRTRRE